MSNRCPTCRFSRAIRDHDKGLGRDVEGDIADTDAELDGSTEKEPLPLYFATQYSLL